MSSTNIFTKMITSQLSERNKKINRTINLFQYASLFRQNIIFFFIS